jgi:cellulose synthase/poly-beta-1,6-N-acetylglucosamine synthase-like glycosyltransferase
MTAMFHCLSAIIPCYNEERTIQEVLLRVQRVELLLGRQIIVVDDCSSKTRRSVGVMVCAQYGLAAFPL